MLHGLKGLEICRELMKIVQQLATSGDRFWYFLVKLLYGSNIEIVPLLLRTVQQIVP